MAVSILSGILTLFLCIPIISYWVLTQFVDIYFDVFLLCALKQDVKDVIVYDFSLWNSFDRIIGVTNIIDDSEPDITALVPVKRLYKYKNGDIRWYT